MIRVLRSCALVLLSLLGVGLIVASGNNSANTFSKSFGRDLDDWVTSAIPTRDGGYLFVGNRDDKTSGDFEYQDTHASPIWMVKLDANGDLEWERGYQDPELATIRPEGAPSMEFVVAAADGGAWLLGKAYEGGNDAISVVRLGADGQVRWIRRYDSTARLPLPTFWPDGIAQEAGPVGVETADGGLWVAVSSQALLDTRPIGRELHGVYLLKLSADGDELTSGHVAMGPVQLRARLRELRVLDGGGVAVLAEADSNAFFMYVVDATVHLLSKTRAEYGDLRPAGLVPLRAGGSDDGYAIVGARDGGSFVARYLNRQRDPDDPGEGADRFEILPLENAWDIAIEEMSEAWAAAPACDARQVVGGRCSLLVVGRSRAAPGDVLLDIVDPDANILTTRVLHDIERVCGIQRQPSLTADGRVAYRMNARDTQGRSGWLLIDEQTVLLQPFTPRPDATCEDGLRASSLPDGETVTLVDSGSYRDGDQSTEVRRHDGAGQPRWSATFRSNAGRWTRAVTVREVDDGYVIAGASAANGRDEIVDALLIKVDASGAPVWQRRIADLNLTSENTNASSNGLAVQDGRYLIVGTDQDWNAHALQFNRSGNLDWQRVLWKQEYTESRGAAAALRDGGWLLGGGNNDASSVPLLRVDSAGQVAWLRSLTGVASIDSLAEGADGQLHLGGTRKFTAIVARLDARGQLLWSNELAQVYEFPLPVRVIAMPDGESLFGVTDFARRVGQDLEPDVDGDGVSDPIEIEIAERSTGDLQLIRLDAQGARVWERRYGGLYADILSSLAATSDGGALVAASSLSLGSRSDRSEAWLLRLGPDGAVNVGCAAELVPADFDGSYLAAGQLTSAPASESSFAPTGAVGARASQAYGLATVALEGSSDQARQCHGEVRRPSEGSAEQARLRVVQGNSAYSGVVSSIPAGILCGTLGGGTCEIGFDRDLLATLTVDPASRDHFESWSGCDSVDDALRCLVRMTADRTITATFAESPRPPIVGLRIDSVSGRGAVSGTGGIQCRATASGTCVTSVTRGSTASLTATADVGRSFLGWAGSCASFGNTRIITFVMNDGLSCVARFSGPPPGAPTVSVQINAPQAGDVTSDPVGIDCGAANSLCSEGFAAGTNVRLTARATQPGWEFDSFLCQGVGRTYERSITLENLTQDVECQATFSPAIERLYLRIVRDIGDDTTDSHVYVDGGGLDCEYDCDRPFERGRTLILRAEPWSDYVLSAWSGCQGVYPDNTHVGANYYCLVNLDQRRDVVAFFSRVQIGSPNGLRSLAVNFAPGSAPGQVTSNPGFIDCRRDDGVCATTFNAGQVVNLDLEPLAGSTLATHEGCDTFTPAGGGQPARCRVTMSADRVLTVGFARPNNPPVAAFTFEPTAPLIGQPVTFNAGSSSDDNGIAGYAWSFTDNGVIDATSSVASRTYTAAGTYTVRLTVTDGDGVSDDEVQTIVVSNPGVVLPVITLQPGSVTVSPGATATFTVSANPGGGTLSYRWQRNGTDIPGATSESHTTPATTTADDGAVFRVVLSNSAGSVVSNSAVLTVGHGWRPVGNALATPAFNPSLAMNSGGDIHVSHTAPLSGLQTLYVRRFNGTTWSIVGDGPVDPASTYSISEHMLITAADGYPIVAWNQGPAARVARWNGTQWDFIGNDLSIDTTDNFGTGDMQIARHGNDLVAAWTETFGFPSTAQRVAVQRYSAATGTWTGGYLPNVSYVGEIRLALDSTGLAAVAYVPRPLSGGVGAIQVMRESAAGWAPLGGDVGPVPVANSNGLVANYGIDIHFDSNDEPVVIGSADSYNIFAFRHSGSAWLPLGPANGVFVALDPATDTTSLMALVRREGYIAMAYTHSHRQANGGTQFLTEFLRWNGSAWEPIGDALSLLNYTLSPELDGGLNPIMAGEHRPPGGFSEVVVRRYVP